MHTALTIAGSDSCGGAGIQADIKTMTALKVYATSVITSLTAQNTTGVFAVSPCSADFLQAQLQAVFTDIPPEAVKTGMISTAEQAEVIARSLKLYGAKNIVTDTVFSSTSGKCFTQSDALDVLESQLFPIAALITPNIAEAEILVRRGRGCAHITDVNDMISAAEYLSGRYGCSVLVKGGHLAGEAVDVLAESGGHTQIFTAERVDNANSHGTGCTLSSAVAAYLAVGKSLAEAVRLAKQYLTGCLKAGLALGKGRGPMNHMWNLATEQK